MYNFFLLLKIRLDEMFEISTTKFQKQFSKKFSYLFHKIIMLLLYITGFYFFYLLAYFLGTLGLAEILPVTGYLGAMVITFISVLLTINETFTGNEDSEFLLSMPISAFNQVIVLFIIVYIKNLLYCIMIEVPFYIVYHQCVSGGCNFGPWLIGLLFTSLPVCGIATLVGMVIILSIVHSPKKNQIMSVISLVFVFTAIIILIAIADTIYLTVTGGSIFENMASLIISNLTSNLKFARFYQLGIVEGQITYTFLFVFMSIIWYAVLLFMHTMAYQTSITALRSPISYGEKDTNDILSLMKENGTQIAMVKKEISQFLGSKSYLMHSMIGIILGIVLPINFLVVGVDEFDTYIAKIPFLICTLVGVSCTTYCALSIEGRRYWIMEASPANLWELNKAKIFVNLIFTLPMAILSGTLFSVAFYTSVLQTLLNILLPASYAFVSAYYGIIINAKFVDYSCESEEMVMNRGTTFLLGYLPVILLPLIFTMIL